MRPRLIFVLLALGLATFGSARDADAQFGWFGGRDRDLALSLVVEDNVRGGCWRDRAATLSEIARRLDSYGIAVKDDAPTNLVLYAIGYPSASGAPRSRLACVGVLQVRVSSLAVADDRSVTVTSLYDQERLLVSHHLLDTVLSRLALELIDNFSRRYSGYFD